jgi:hypothetical protein
VCLCLSVCPRRVERRDTFCRLQFYWKIIWDFSIFAFWPLPFITFHLNYYSSGSSSLPFFMCEDTEGNVLLLLLAVTTHLRILASLFLRFRDSTQWHNIVVRTPLDEWSARRRDLYLTTHNTQNRQYSCPRRDSNPQSQQASGCRSMP